jgi:hypothetical protein
MQRFAGEKPREDQLEVIVQCLSGLSHNELIHDVLLEPVVLRCGLAHVRLDLCLHIGGPDLNPDLARRHRAVGWEVAEHAHANRRHPTQKPDKLLVEEVAAGRCL